MQIYYNEREIQQAQLVVRTQITQNKIAATIAGEIVKHFNVAIAGINLKKSTRNDYVEWG